MYVLAIDLCAVPSMAGRTIWRFPDNEEAALAQWFRIQSLIDFGSRAKDNGEIVELKAARLYQAANAEDTNAARQAVLAGLAPLRNTGDDAMELSDDELGSLDDLIGRAYA